MKCTHCNGKIRLIDHEPLFIAKNNEEAVKFMKVDKELYATYKCMECGRIGSMIGEIKFKVNS